MVLTRNQFDSGAAHCSRSFKKTSQANAGSSPALPRKGYVAELE